MSNTRLQPQTKSYNWSSLEATLERFVPAQIGGLGFLLSDKYQILYHVALGDLSLDSILPVASSSKVPSALIILSLVRDGYLELDTPVIDYMRGRIDWSTDKSAITMRMLLNHTSGLVGIHTSLTDRDTSLEACTRELAGTTLDFIPGAQFAYGNGGYQVAGFVAEVINGKNWHTLCEERLCQPLGLTQFTYRGREFGSDSNPVIGGGATSDIMDYHKIMSLFLNRGTMNGVEIIPPDFIRLMSTNQIKGLPRFRSPGGDRLTGYSFGFWISEPFIHPGSSGPEISDQGAYGCTPWVDLDLGYAAVLFIRDHVKTGTKIWDAIRPLIIEQLIGR